VKTDREMRDLRQARMDYNEELKAEQVKGATMEVEASGSQSSFDGVN